MATVARRGAARAAPANEEHETVHVMSREEARRAFDAVARRYLNISGEEFLRRWQAGDYDDDADRFPVRRVAMMRHIIE